MCICSFVFMLCVTSLSVQSCMRIAKHSLQRPRSSTPSTVERVEENCRNDARNLSKKKNKKRISKHTTRRRNAMRNKAGGALDHRWISNNLSIAGAQYHNEISRCSFTANRTSGLIRFLHVTDTRIS